MKSVNFQFYGSKLQLLKKIVIHTIILFFFIMVLSSCTPAKNQQGNGNILLIDDFSTHENSWNVWENEAGSAISYYQDGLVFIINTSQFDYVSVPKGDFGDVRIEATANKLTGPDDNDFGIVCRFQDEKNYYGFIVSSDGYYGIIKVKKGAYQLLNGTNLEFSPMIHGGFEFNHLRADCIGNILNFYINETKLVEVTDSDFSFGKVGLMAGSFKTPGVAILFDNFLVLKP